MTRTSPAVFHRRPGRWGQDFAHSFAVRSNQHYSNADCTPRDSFEVVGKLILAVLRPVSGHVQIPRSSAINRSASGAGTSARIAARVAVNRSLTSSTDTSRVVPMP